MISTCTMLQPWQTQHGPTTAEIPKSCVQLLSPAHAALHTAAALIQASPASCWAPIPQLIWAQQHCIQGVACQFVIPLPCVHCAGQHMEEMKYLSSQINMLKDKLALADRDMAVAHAIKVRMS